MTVLTSLALLSAQAHAQTGSDLCSGAPTISDGTFLFNNTGYEPASNTTMAFCTLDQTAGDLWYRYIPVSSGFITFSTCGSSIDTLMSLHSSCTSPALDCNDDDFACGDFGSSITWSGTAGVPIYVRIAGRKGFMERGAGKLTIIFNPAPANDNCDAPKTITEGITNFDNRFATLDLETNCAFGQHTDHDLWYRFVPTFSGWLSIDTCLTTGADTVISVLRACDQDAVVENDNHCDLNAQVSLQVTSGVAILIRVAGGGEMSWKGLGQLRLSRLSVTPPENDRCDQAQLITPGTYIARNAQASTDCLDIQNCFMNGHASNDVWYLIRPATSGTCEIYTESPSPRVLSMYRDCSNAGLPAQNSNGDSMDSVMGAEVLRFCVTAGQEYRVRVAMSQNSWPDDAKVYYTLKSASAYALPSPRMFETEPCNRARTADTYNGGCSDGSSLYTSLSKGTVMVGTIFTTAQGSDEDHYLIHVDGSAHLIITGQSRAAVGISLYSKPSGMSCPLPLLASTGNAQPCRSDFALDRFVPPGDYVLAVTHTDATELLTCESGLGQYWISWTTNVNCTADFNHDGVATAEDIFAFLGAWFAGNSSANVDSTPGVTVTDIFQFLSSWFLGC